jgi:hypothetical protein
MYRRLITAKKANVCDEQFLKKLKCHIYGGIRTVACMGLIDCSPPPSMMADEMQAWRLAVQHREVIACAGSRPGMMSPAAYQPEVTAITHIRACRRMSSRSINPLLQTSRLTVHHHATPVTSTRSARPREVLLQQQTPHGTSYLCRT